MGDALGECVDPEGNLISGWERPRAPPTVGESRPSMCVLHRWLDLKLLALGPGLLEPLPCCLHPEQIRGLIASVSESKDMP